MKKLSVIIPVYNAQRWIAETLHSVFESTYSAIEVICIDDGSTDSSVDIINEHQNVSNIKLVKKINAGVSAARNLGIAYASGDYIAFLDADDTVDATMYEKLIYTLETESSDACFCAFSRFREGASKICVKEINWHKVVQNPNDIKYFLIESPPIINEAQITTSDIHGSCCRAVYKRKLIVDHKITFCENLKFSEDQIFVLHVLSNCKKVSYVDEMLLNYRAATKPWKYHDLYENMLHLLKYQKEILENNPFYSKYAKRKIEDYLNISTYYAIINEELMFKNNAAEILKKLNSDSSFSKLLTFSGFIEKIKIRKSLSHIVLYVLLITKQYKLLQLLFPNKRYKQ